MQARLFMVAVLAALAVVGCGDDAGTSGTFELSSAAAEEYATAYIASVVADPDGDDLAVGGGEHLVIENNANIRIDMGGWWIDVGGERLPLGFSRQIYVGAELRVHPGPGETSETAVFVGLDEEILDDDGGLVVLRDAAGTEVARLAYGTAAG